MNEKIERAEKLSWARINFAWENYKEAKDLLDEFLKTIEDDSPAANELAKGLEEINKWWEERRKEITKSSDGWFEKLENPEEQILLTQIDIEALHKFLVLCEHVARKHDLV